MIKLTDATVLALTKLRARKIRTIATTLLASLLFGVLVAGSLIVTGAFASVNKFSKDGLTNRYIVSVSNAVVNAASSSVLRNPELIAKAKVQYAQLVEKKTTEAKRLGLSYSQASDQPPYTKSIDGIERLYLTDQNGIVRALMADKYGNQTYIDTAKLKSRAVTYNAMKLFTVENLSLARGSTLSVFPNGKEVFYDTADGDALNANYTRPIIDGTFPLATPDLTASFMLPGNAGWTAQSKTLPIIVPQDVAEQLLGLEKLPDTAKVGQKFDRIKEVRSKDANLTFEACYRNGASISFIQQTVVQQKDIQTHSSDKGYVKPSRIYQLPDSTTCTNPTISADTRTATQMRQDENQMLFDQEFNFYSQPKSYFVTFKVVGISPTQTTNETGQQNRSASDVVNNLLRTTGVGQLIPKQLYDQIPDKSTYADLLAFEPYYLLGSEDNKTRYVEFANASDAQKFIDEQSCTSQYDGTCKPVGRDYMATLAFSDSIAINDIRSKVTDWFNLAIIAIVILATIVMWITVGRTIADGRHETAVFRAIGFKRIDISLIYTIYTIVLSFYAAVLAGVIGFTGAYFVDKIYAPQLTAQAQYAFGGLDLSKEFSLIGLNFEQLGLILVACFATGLLSMIVPLIHNVRRSPIKDMRDEG